VIVVSEVLAGIVLREAAQERLWLPDQLSVVGFDSTAFCESTVPRLTAISQPLAAMAYDAVACLIDDRAMFAKGDIVSRVFPCGLDVRDSTGPPVA
jgi:LacI family transcriptional regulator